MLALTIADLLMINLLTTDIGRYEASCYGLLKTIFEVNLKLFDQNATKKIVFVIRDYLDKDNNFERLKSGLEKDMQNIWTDMMKPEKFSKANLSDFFIFEY